MSVFGGIMAKEGVEKRMNECNLQILYNEKTTGNRGHMNKCRKIRMD